MAFLDVRRASFYATATEEAYTEPPPEEREEGEDLVGLLQQTLYGTRSAAKNWQLQLRRNTTGLGLGSELAVPLLARGTRRADCGARRLHLGAGGQPVPSSPNTAPAQGLRAQGEGRSRPGPRGRQGGEQPQ